MRPARQRIIKHRVEVDHVLVHDKDHEKKDYFQYKQANDITIRFRIQHMISVHFHDDNALARAIEVYSFI